jgi:hypothetical protein
MNMISYERLLYDKCGYSTPCYKPADVWKAPDGKWYPLHMKHNIKKLFCDRKDGERTAGKHHITFIGEIHGKPEYLYAILDLLTKNKKTRVLFLGLHVDEQSLFDKYARGEITDAQAFDLFPKHCSLKSKPYDPVKCYTALLLKVLTVCRNSKVDVVCTESGNLFNLLCCERNALISDVIKTTLERYQTKEQDSVEAIMLIGGDHLEGLWKLQDFFNPTEMAFTMRMSTQ